MVNHSEPSIWWHEEHPGWYFSILPRCCITCHSWSMSSCGVLLRRQSTSSVSLPPLQPTSFPSCVARLRASEGLTEAQGQLGTPLWRMALVKVGRLSGDKRWNPTEAPPALSPKIVTCWTHTDQGKKGSQTYVYKQGIHVKLSEINLFGVPTEEMYVVLYPLQRHPLVQQPHVARSFRGAMEGEKAEGTDAVVHGNHNYRLAVSQVTTIINIQRRGAAVESWEMLSVALLTGNT